MSIVMPSIKGAEFSATQGALASCTACHNDSNQKLYNGRKVGTPHGGTFGYPVVNGEWSAKSINDEEWDLRKLAVVRLPTDSGSEVAQQPVSRAARSAREDLRRG